MTSIGASSTSMMRSPSESRQPIISSDCGEDVYCLTTVVSELFMRLGVDEKNAVNDACKIEHVISSATFAALKKHLNDYK